MRPPGYKYDREILVGLFVMLGIFVVAIFSLKITDTPVYRSGTEFTVYIQDANGIFRNSKVKIAGINVGVVKDIKLEDGQAKIKLLLDKGYTIEKGSFILPRSQGILGDRFLEIVLPQNEKNIQVRSRNIGWAFCYARHFCGRNIFAQNYRHSGL